MKDYHHQRDFDFTIEHIIFSLFTISLFLSFSARSLCCQAAVGLTPCRRQSSLAPSCARRSMSAARVALRAPRSTHASSGQRGVSGDPLFVRFIASWKTQKYVHTRARERTFTATLILAERTPAYKKYTSFHGFKDSRSHAVSQRTDSLN